LKKITIAILISVALSAGGAMAAEEHNTHSDGTRNIPLHRMTLKDIDDRAILPTTKRAMPFSARHTCGACHEYDTIAKGLHFNSSKSKCSGRIGEPWVWVDSLTGMQLPLSNRNWPGVYSPDQLGITPWSFTKMFGRHMPGGDFAAPDDTDDVNARWVVSGKAEINCMACHNASYRQDHSEWAKQMMRENFRWAATAAAGLGEVGGMASRQPNTWNVYQGPSPDDTGYATPPAVRYDLSLFDSKHRALLNISSPTDRRCLTCHATARAGDNRWRADMDVHSAAGMKCVQCHRNGISHQTVRGYPAEAAERKDPDIASLSCSGCHLGAPEAGGVRKMGGRLGAPVPKHDGLPTVHFQKLTCTACHSGPWPKSEPTRVRTARANRMGIFGRAQWYRHAPNISEGVFVKGPDGMIGPRRMMWPAFWGRLTDGKVTPLKPHEVAPAAKGILDAPQQIGRILNALAGPLADEVTAVIEARVPERIEKFKIGGLPVFVQGNKIYRLNADGGLDVSEHTGKPPILIGSLARDWRGEALTLIRRTDPDANKYFNDDPDIRDEIRGTVASMIKSLTDLPGKREAVLDYGNAIFRRDLVKSTDPVSGKDRTDWGLVKTDRSSPRLRVPRFMWLVKGELKELVPGYIVQSAVSTAGVEESFTEQQVAMVLGRLESQEEGGKFAYI